LAANKDENNKDNKKETKRDISFPKFKLLMDTEEESKDLSRMDTKA
jgi:hypothetical protein